MRQTMKLILATAGVLTAAILLSSASPLQAAAPTAEQIEFFETKIRPVLVEQCYECHNSAETAEGGLALDDRKSLLQGGDSGAIVVPHKPAQSRLLAILRHEVDGMKMPQGGGKLSVRVVADFEKWIAIGAPDPRDAPPSAKELAEATSWEAVFAKRKRWWSLQPIRKPDPPDLGAEHSSTHPVDRFILAKLREHSLEPSAPADAHSLVRRLYVALIGLPPTADQVKRWAPRMEHASGFDELVDHLLASPHFGERWARHWMDWIRYAESHGSEGDPPIEGASLYRDYLIRALNADVPYDQLVREHVAGDVLEQPRINKDLGINESAIGPAHWRMVYHGFAPTDALEEKARFIDDQINTFSKAFLGVTVACARCHDHKFDAISQKDYYAIFGVLASCRPGRIAIDSPEKLAAHRDKLASLKPQIRASIADAWLAAAATLPAQLLAQKDSANKPDDKPSPLDPWFAVRKDVVDGARFSDTWKGRVDGWQADRQKRQEHAKRGYLRRWDLSNATDYASWFRYGDGLADKPTAAGEFAVATSGDSALLGIYPAGAYSHLLSAKSPARLTSGNVRLDGNDDLWLRATGDESASARFVVQDYPRNGTVYPIKPLTSDWQWQTFDMTYWNGDEIHIELAAAKDAPLLVKETPRSWFGIREAVIVRKGEPGPPADTLEHLDPIFEMAAGKPPQSMEELAKIFAGVVNSGTRAWRAGTMTDAQALLLDACLKQNLLTNRLDQLAAARPLLEEYRRQEEAIAVPTRAPGLEETVGHDQSLFVRGNHKTPGDVVPRGFLEAIDPAPYTAAQSGRRRLAEDLVRRDNPLTRRVIVNRIWHHLFGRGLAATPDNLGRLGQEPTHPELLDFLASRFGEDHWSIKDAIRLIVTSKTWQASSRPSSKALQLDPDNQLLSHAFVRRLDAEALRDSLLRVSGQLDPTLFGSSVGGGSNRRSVYVRVNRNSLDPFLRTFDFPEPFSAVGRRDVTNVPAQSLTLMNDERVMKLAERWAQRLLADRRYLRDEQRIEAMLLSALGRPAGSAEINQFQAYLAKAKANQATLIANARRLRDEMERRRDDIRRRIEPVQARLLEQAKTSPSAGEQAAPRPIARWDFEDGLVDFIGSAHGESRGGAKVESGSLVVNQQAHVVTAPIGKTIREKTLEAWVQLDSLNQRGGGVMTLQTPDGVVFDAIVFAEQQPGQWLAGSNGFVRTTPFGGLPETEAVGRPVHVAIAYYSDGRIVGYRDGKPYGKPYKSNGPMEFQAGKAIVGFGVRHLPAGGNRMLSGRIAQARLYDRALSAAEIDASFRSAPGFLSDEQILAAMNNPDRDQVESDRRRIVDLQAELESLGEIPDAANEIGAWTSLAHAIFTFQEFLYVK